MLKSFFIVGALMLSGLALGRAPEVLINVRDEPALTASGKQLDATQLTDVIRKTAESKKWAVINKPDGNLTASLSWNGNKHTMVVDITITGNSYAITYRDSVNLNYKADSMPVIHPYYNRYVGELKNAIRVNLLAY